MILKIFMNDIMFSIDDAISTIKIHWAYEHSAYKNRSHLYWYFSID